MAALKDYIQVTVLTQVFGDDRRNVSFRVLKGDVPDTPQAEGQARGLLAAAAFNFLKTLNDQNIIAARPLLVWGYQAESITQDTETPSLNEQKCRDSQFLFKGFSVKPNELDNERVFPWSVCKPGKRLNTVLPAQVGERDQYNNAITAFISAVTPLCKKKDYANRSWGYIEADFGYANTTGRTVG